MDLGLWTVYTVRFVECKSGRVTEKFLPLFLYL